jgi:hypothetical protein
LEGEKSKLYEALSRQVQRKDWSGWAGGVPLDEAIRLLRLARNISAKNNSAVLVTRHHINFLLVASADSSAVKNTLAEIKVIVLQGVLDLKV